MGRKTEPPQMGHIVKEWYNGNTHCIICDDYCREKTPEQVREILARCAAVAYPNLLKQETERKSREKTEKAEGDNSE